MMRRPFVSAAITCFQLGDMLCVEPAAYAENHFAVLRPVNSEHSVLLKKIFPTEMQVQAPTSKWLKLRALLDLIIYDTRQFTNLVKISRKVGGIKPEGGLFFESRDLSP